MYVVNINAKKIQYCWTKRIFDYTKIKLRDLNILGSEKEFKNLFIKVRSTGKLLKAKLFKISKCDVEIIDEEME